MTPTTRPSPCFREMTPHGYNDPPEFAHVASLVGASAELFAWDEDNLRAVADHVAAFAGGTIPSLADAESAAQRFMDSTAGAAADAFGGHWTGAASGGDAGDFTRTALTGATVMAVAAGAIKIIKMGVIGRLVWCARNLAAAALPGAGALRAAQAVGMARTSIRALVDRLLKHLRERVAPVIQRANDNFRDILQGPRPAFAGVPAPRRSPCEPDPPHLPKTIKRSWRRRMEKPPAADRARNPLLQRRTANGQTSKRTFSSAKWTTRIRWLDRPKNLDYPMPMSRN